MRTYKNLWDKFISVENFEKAYHDARLGKVNTKSVKRFEKNKSENLEKIRQLVLKGEFHTSSYKEMTIFEPKKRTIYKLPFSPDRIVQHALMNILIPIFQPMFIYDSYACIEGKGQMRAMHRCNEFVRRNRYCLKCDIRKFYPPINHAVLYRMIGRKIKDKKAPFNNPRHNPFISWIHKCSYWKLYFAMVRELLFDKTGQLRQAESSCQGLFEVLRRFPSF